MSQDHVLLLGAQLVAVQSSRLSGDLSPVWVPDAQHESLRDLVPAREAAKEDELRARHRLSKYLLRYGQRPGEGCRAWTANWWKWVRALKLPHDEQNTTLLDHIMEVDHQAQRIERLEGAIDRAVQSAPAHLKAIVDALQSLRGVAKLTAITLATEFGTFRRFERAGEVVSYTGLVPSERSSGAKSRRGAITRRATRTCVAFWSNPPGTTVIDPICA